MFRPLTGTPRDIALLVARVVLGASLTTGSYAAVLVSQHGFELEGVIFTGALLLMVTGAGRFSIDHIASSRRGAGDEVARTT
jgi:uncharacterized membrane protein YphA (DoxX/SURF4 family)